VSPTLESYWPQVFRFALSLTRDAHLAEDLAQDTIVRACQRLGQLKSAAATRAWLFRIAANLWKDQLRRHESVTTLAGEHGVRAIDCPVTQLSLQEDVRETISTISALPETQRAVLHLYAVEDLPLVEIAEILNLKRATVRVHLCMARKTIRARLPHIWNEVKSRHQQT
jgi:RNA polymerase sigma-70 factor, ECF subfamily